VDPDRPPAHAAPVQGDAALLQSAVDLRRVAVAGHGEYASEVLLGELDDAIHVDRGAEVGDVAAQEHGIGGAGVVEDLLEDFQPAVQIGDGNQSHGARPPAATHRIRAAPLAKGAAQRDTIMSRNCMRATGRAVKPGARTARPRRTP